MSFKPPDPHDLATINDQRPDPRASAHASALALLLGMALAGCTGGTEPPASVEQAVTGQCTRDIPVLRGPATTCTIDAQCACGSHCDTVEHTCAFTCMVPPANQAESCATGTQCDDTGRCVAPNATPPATAPTLATTPAALTTVVGGAPQALQVKLAVYTGGAALIAAAVTPVLAHGSDGAKVSCDGGASFADDCTLTSWTFQFDGTRYNASKSLLARTVAGTPLGEGEVHLRIDASDSDTVVPVSATAALAATPDGDYHGIVTTYQVPAGLPISARIVGHNILVRDPTRTLAASGGVVLDMYTPSNPAPIDALIPWLRAPGATPTQTNSLPATYGPLTFTSDPATGTLSGFTYFTLLGGSTMWTLNLARDPQAAPSCQVDAECASGQACSSAVHACVATDGIGGATLNGFTDDRLAQWWSQLQVSLGFGDIGAGSASPAFATTDADMIESLMCSASIGTAVVTGRLGLTQVQQGTGPSRSGDLTCVTDAGVPSSVPGAIGLATYVDRNGTAPSAALLQTCLADLTRTPTSSFAANFSPSVGQCVNLARALPALRLLASGELGKHTSLNTSSKWDSRLQSLFFRLLQQWTQLHGFVASTGLAERAFEDATTATPAAARAALLSLLDVLDEGWALLLDFRLAQVVQNQTTSESGSDDDVFGPELDYRTGKQPLAYWTFNHGADAARDVMHGATLTSQQPFCKFPTKGGCHLPSSSCVIQAARDSFSNAFSCPGVSAHVAPAPGAPGLSDGGDLTVTFNIDPLDVEIAPYGGGTMFASSTLAVVETRDAAGPMLNLIHPSAAGPEWVVFRLGELGHWTGGTTGGDGPPQGTSVAVVRDALAKTYTVYVFNTESINGVQAFTHGYTNTVQGALSQVPANTVMIGAGPYNGTGMWAAAMPSGGPPLRSSYAARIDDVAIWPTMLSKREFVRFASARQYAETHRDVWPQDLVLADYATQELKTPVATSTLDALSSHLELADRLAVHMRYEAQAACDSGDPTARADIDTIVARLGRTLRQSLAVQALVAGGDADSTNKDRALVGAKTSQLIRDLTTLTQCRNPYGMGDHEVPLYFSSIAPNVNEKDAFFAASDHVLQLAEQRTQTAQVALDAVRTRWDQARQSQIQQLQDDNTRATRVDELQIKYGETLVRLCGISDRTPQQILADVNAGTFSLDTCFVKSPSGTTCPTSNTSGPVMDAEPTCYRGALGGALTDTRSAYYAEQAAYQSWQAAIGNSAAATKLCVLKEMDVFGCSALDRNKLTGVTCPFGFEGTIQLTQDFNAEMIKAEQAKSWFDTVLHTVTTIAAVASAAATGPGAAFVIAAVGALQPLSTEMGNSMEDRKRAHEATLQARALTEDVRACWATADQYERAIAAAEQASQEASSRMQAAVITFENGVAEGREVMAVAPQEIDRELDRPSIPIAFHYWLPEALETYQLAYESARRYTYMALRATEYDMLESYAAPQAGKPSRATVLGAWLPTTLSNQLAMMRDQTNTRQTLHGPPRLGHMVFDLGGKFFGLPDSSDDFGAALVQYAQPVYSEHGEYLGLGVRFSLVPNAQDESPTWRCAERIWRVNIGASRLPFSADGTHVKLLKRNVFASRTCDGDGFQVASLRPGTNLLVGSGDATAYVAENTSSVADVALADFDQPDALFNFKTRDDYLNGSSSELALQELYGDYVLLFPASALTTGLDLSVLHDFYLRFDFLSIDNTPPIAAVLPKRLADASPGPIVLSTEGSK